MKGPQILNLPPPFSPVPNSHPPKSPETDPILPGPLLSILPARPLHKKAQNECPCFIFCSFRHLIIPPPPPHPDAFPLATSKRQHASYNNNSLSQQKRKTKNSHTNQPASQRQAKVSNEQRMHAKTTTITAAARQKAKRGPPADRLHPQIKKKQEQQVGAAYAHPSPPPRTSLAPQKIFFSAPRPPFPPETTS